MKRLLAERRRVARTEHCREPLVEGAKRLVRDIYRYSWLAAMGFLICGPMAHAQKAVIAPKAVESPAKAKTENPIKSFFTSSFNIADNVGDLKLLREKEDGATYANVRSLFESLESGKMGLEGIDAQDMTSEVKKANSRILKFVDMRMPGFTAYFDVENSDMDNGSRNVAIMSNGANGQDGRFFVSEVNVPKECEIVKAEPFFMRNTEDLAQVGAYLKYVDRRDHKTYQLMMSVIYSKSNIGLAKTSYALRAYKDSGIYTATYINRQIGKKQ